MGRPGGPIRAVSGLGALKEGDIRRLVGPDAFRWGDQWQREAHVDAVGVTTEGLRGTVLGTRRRVDNVSVSVAGGQIRSTCTCNEGNLCRHAAALLLQWARQPQLFGQVQANGPLDSVYLDE